MIKKIFIAAALVIASPALVFSQDVFWSFDSESNVTTTTGAVGTSGTAYIFSERTFGFDALDLDFTSSDSSVLLLTGGTAFNDPFTTIGGNAFDSAVVTINTGADGNLFAVNVTQNGINPRVVDLFYPLYVPEAGSGSGAVRLAEVTYDIVGEGEATLDFTLGIQGALQLPDVVLNPSFGTASLIGESRTPAIPEPSSSALLVLGAAGMVARRRRACA